LTRIGNLRKEAFSENNFDGYLIFNAANQLYFLGFPGTSALLIPPEGEATAYVYGVNFEQAKAMGKDIHVELVRSNENFLAKIAKKAIDGKIKRLEVDALGVQTWVNLIDELEGCKVEVDNSHIESLRLVKDKQEIEYMRKAGELTSEGMKSAFEAVKPGAKEFEVAAEIEYTMRSQGAGPTAFETIVASGACSAFPHGGCSGREIQEGDLVVVDIGATYEYYCSDMTRTFVAGKPSAKQQKIYDTVRLAQQKAFEAAKAGLVASDLDAVARKFIKDAGFGEYFVHRLGHGVGLEIHEKPVVSPRSEAVVEEGMVFTIEPGIYVPGFGGVRIEDTVAVTADGCVTLTQAPKDLIVL
jgi:Xaa-Pro aminopeptidase